MYICEMKRLAVLLLTLQSWAVPVISQVSGACEKGTFPVVHNGDSSLGLTYLDSACGLNYVQGSALIETRYNQYTTAGNIGTGVPATISISGLPATAAVVRAYLWYMVVPTETVAPTNTSVTLTNPSLQVVTHSSSLIGKSGTVCWLNSRTAAYRADVTSTIAGNGTYELDILGFVQPDADIEGATLMIIYKDTTAVYEGNLRIYDGMWASTNGGALSQTVTVTACANSISANSFIVLGDMQDNQNGNQHSSTIYGTTTNFPNNFWNFDSAPVSVSQGQTSAAFGASGLYNDCFGWVAMGLYYQTNCSICPVITGEQLLPEEPLTAIYLQSAGLSVDFGINSPDIADVVVLNLLGEVILETSVPVSGKQMISLPELSPSVYFVTVKTSVVEVTKKMVVAK